LRSLIARRDGNTEHGTERHAINTPAIGWESAGRRDQRDLKPMTNAARIRECAISTSVAGIAAYSASTAMNRSPLGGGGEVEPGRCAPQHDHGHDRSCRSDRGEHATHLRVSTNPPRRR
jgi:hypothetical protein